MVEEELEDEDGRDDDRDIPAQLVLPNMLSGLLQKAARSAVEGLESQRGRTIVCGSPESLHVVHSFSPLPLRPVTFLRKINPIAPGSNAGFLNLSTTAA